LHGAEVSWHELPAHVESFVSYPFDFGPRFDAPSLACSELQSVCTYEAQPRRLSPRDAYRRHCANRCSMSRGQHWLRLCVNSFCCPCMKQTVGVFSWPFVRLCRCVGKLPLRLSLRTPRWTRPDRQTQELRYSHISCAVSGTRLCNA
jgi:hypothetical protein